MKLTFLGTGTSYGLPYIGCDCAVCRSDNPRNKRLRCSVLVEAGRNEQVADEEKAQKLGEGAVEHADVTRPTRLLVDTTPDFRQQLLRAEVSHVSAVLWTHSHNDHIIGLDDIRPLCDRAGYIDGYTNAETMAHLQHVFGYAFVPGRDHGGFPRMRSHLVEPGQSFQVGDIRVTAVPILHYRREIFAYRFEHGGRTLVYATDCSHIPGGSWELMQGADVLVLGALRYKEHVAHFSLQQAIDAAGKLKPGRTLFTHMAHDLDHDATNAMLPAGIELAYDTLSFEF
jgi:phosphoribosyl 1,2-cyclic phosphate phosphodiesterase